MRVSTPSTIRIGSARERLVLPNGIKMAGFAARTGRAVGVADPPLQVSAIAFDRVTLVLLDVLSVDASLVDEIRAASEMTDLEIHVHAIHTHSGPAVRGDLQGLDRAARTALVAASGRCIRQAQDQQIPCQLEAMQVLKPDLVVSRLDGAPIPDAPLRAIRWRRVSGQVMGSLIVYPVHPTTAGPSNLLLSPDYPGFLRKRLSTIDAPCHFATGCAGDARMRPSFVSKCGNPRRTLDESRQYADAIAHAVQSASWSPVDLTKGIRSASAEVELSMEPRGPAPELLLPQWEQQLTTADEAQAGMLHPLIAWARMEHSGKSGSWRGSVSWVGLGDLALYLLPGEPFLDADRALAHGASNVLVLGYTDDSPGYIPDSAAYHHGSYEVDEAYRYFRMPSPFAPGSLDVLAERASQLPLGGIPAQPSGEPRMDQRG